MISKIACKEFSAKLFIDVLKSEMVIMNRFFFFSYLIVLSIPPALTHTNPLTMAAV